jgi:DNA replication initiation complex subunit (GINS family)
VARFPEVTVSERVDGGGRDEQADGRLAEAAVEIEQLRAEVQRLSEENRAFVTSVRHMTRAAEEVLAEARQEAAETRARAAAEAYERLIVARADARAAVHEERQRTAAEIELLAAVRERITDERATLSMFQNQLSGRLRELVRAVFDFEENAPTLAAGPSWESTDHDPVPDMVVPDEPVVRVADDVAFVEAVLVEDRPPVADMDPADDAEEELEAAFAAFFSADVEGEPSRNWILNHP